MKPKYFLTLLLVSAVAFAAGTRLKTRIGINSVAEVNPSNMDNVLSEAFVPGDEVSSEDLNIKFKAVELKLGTVSTGSSTQIKAYDDYTYVNEANYVGKVIDPNDNTLANWPIFNQEVVLRSIYVDFNDNDILDDGEAVFSTATPYFKKTVKAQYDGVILVFFDNGSPTKKMVMSNSVGGMVYKQLGADFYTMGFDTARSCGAANLISSEAACLQQSCYYDVVADSCSHSQNQARSAIITLRSTDPKIEVWSLDQNTLIETINFSGSDAYNFDFGTQFYESL